MVSLLGACNTLCAVSANINHRRWSFYILLVWAFIQWVAVCLFVPETYHPVLLRNKARALRKESGNDRWQAPIKRLERSIPLVSLSLPHSTR